MRHICGGGWISPDEPFNLIAVIMRTLESVGVVYIIFYFFYKMIEVLARRRERQMLVSKLAENPCMAGDGAWIQKFIESLQRGSVGSVFGWLRPTCFVIGLGIGFLVAYIFVPAAGFNSPEYNLLTTALVLTCSGLGMLVAFFIERRWRSKDRKAGSCE